MSTTSARSHLPPEPLFFSGWTPQVALIFNSLTDVGAKFPTTAEACGGGAELEGLRDGCGAGKQEEEEDSAELMRQILGAQNKPKP